MQPACTDKLIQRFDADPSEFFFAYTAIGRNLNLEAYRRIYPPAHMQRMAVSAFHEFQFPYRDNSSTGTRYPNPTR